MSLHVEVCMGGVPCVCKWMVLWHKESILAVGAELLLESGATLNPGRVIHLASTFSGGAYVRSSCVHLGLLARPQTQGS